MAKVGYLLDPECALGTLEEEPVCL
jgi:hypothetical protein